MSSTVRDTEGLIQKKVKDCLSHCRACKWQGWVKSRLLWLQILAHGMATRAVRP